MAAMPADTPERATNMQLEEDGGLLPTHKLKAIKAGDNSVQLLVSTKDHLYDADGVEAGTHSCQVIGAWDESALGELSSILQSRSRTTAPGTKQSAGFNTRFGDGHKLGSQ
ncbi:hypothetical protein NLG97_g101 [Lecanicillium saksenae]|uniref:Uncharacterized protein n=1 Tax=Lecanicillium saksenae TaxID=468837 RepID=A0ACC1R993_9HYPO|nr:hypothetical protein NLG97_g101 [Lecanicillium saksenae]